MVRSESFKTLSKFKMHEMLKALKMPRVFEERLFGTLIGSNKILESSMWQS